MKILKNTTLDKIINMPKGEKILSKHGVPCVACPMAKFELSQLKLMDVCNIYGLELEAILKDLNKANS